MQIFTKDELGRLLPIQLIATNSPKRPIPFHQGRFFNGALLGSPGLVGEYIDSDIDGNRCITCKYWITHNMYGEKMDLICGDPFVLRGMVLIGAVVLGILASISYWVFQQNETEAYFLVNKTNYGANNNRFPVKRLS